jgi:Cu+-exporting ATPase
MAVSIRIVKDAVCQMELDENQVKESLTYKGRRYYFCSIGCRAEFERHPEDYTQVAPLEDGVKNDV